MCFRGFSKASPHSALNRILFQILRLKLVSLAFFGFSASIGPSLGCNPASRRLLHSAEPPSFFQSKWYFTRRAAAFFEFCTFAIPSVAVSGLMEVALELAASILEQARRHQSVKTNKTSSLASEHFQVCKLTLLHRIRTNLHKKQVKNFPSGCTKSSNLQHPDFWKFCFYSMMTNFDLKGFDEGSKKGEKYYFLLKPLKTVKIIRKPSSLDNFSIGRKLLDLYMNNIVRFT